MSSITPRQKSAAGPTGGGVDQSSAGHQEDSSSSLSHDDFRAHVVGHPIIGVRWWLSHATPSGEWLADQDPKWALTRRSAKLAAAAEIKKRCHPPAVSVWRGDTLIRWARDQRDPSPMGDR